MDRVQKKHNILTSPTTSESLGTSESSNITAESSGFVGDDSNSLFPKLKEQKEWAAGSTSSMDHEIDRRENAVNRK